MKISRPNSQLLIIKDSRIINFILLVVTGTVTPILAISYIQSSDLEGRAIIGVPILLVLLIIGFFTTLKNMISVNEFIVDSLSRVIKRNDTKLASFDDIKSLKITTIKPERINNDEYRLDIVLDNGKEIEVVKNSSIKLEVTSLADEIADLLGVRVVNKEENWRK